MNNKAFTLIEILVAVLIIGILAAIAVPQYKKAVMRSKAAQMQTLLNEVVKASDQYYLQNGEYPTKIEDLDIGIDLPSLNYRPCLGDVGAGYSVKQNGDYAIAIHSSNASTLLSNVIAAYFITGKYKCRGFAHVQKWKGKPPQEDITYCMEARYYLDCGTYCEMGIFCKDIMGKKSSTGTAGGLMTVYY